MKLTKKQEGFCQSYHLYGNATEAYRKSFEVDKMSEQSINVEASNLLNHPKVTLRLKTLQDRARERHKGLSEKVTQQLKENALCNITGETIDIAKQLNIVSEPQIVSILKTKSMEKMKSLQSLARILGMNQDSLDINSSSEENAKKAEMARDRLKSISGNK